jgi:hypothetical protein
MWQRVSHRPVMLQSLMYSLIRELRIIAALMLIGAGLGLIGALIHTEPVMDGPAKESVASRSSSPAHMRPAGRRPSGAILVRVKAATRRPPVRRAIIH